MLAEHDIHYHNSLDSTNEECKRLIKSGMARHNTVVITAEQQAGKGQYGRTWQMQPDLDLAMSVIWKEHPLDVKWQSRIIQELAIVMQKALSPLSPQPLRIKPPNDIYAGDLKLAGILCESSILGEQIEYVIIGIGVNVLSEHFPKDIQPTSLKLLGSTADIAEVVTAVLAELDAAWASIFRRSQ